MKESYGKDLASHSGSESCTGGRKATGEALTGAHAGQPLSCEIRSIRVPTLLSYAEGNIREGVTGKPSLNPAQSQTLCTHGNPSYEKREIPQVPATNGEAGRSGKVADLTPDMHACGKSDGCIVPKKLPNKAGLNPVAEAVEGRQPTKGNTLQEAAPRTQSRTSASIPLQRVRETARPG